MHECNAKENPNEKHFWPQKIERLNTRTIGIQKETMDM